MKFEIKANFSKKTKSFLKPKFRNVNFEMLQSERRKTDESPEVDVECKVNICWLEFTAFSKRM